MRRIFPSGNGRRARNREHPPSVADQSIADPEPCQQPAGGPSRPPAGSGEKQPVADEQVVPRRPLAPGVWPPAGRFQPPVNVPRESHEPVPHQAGISRPGWAPIVVDEPIFEFEAKPPFITSEYRPDTVFDGWSTDAFTVRLASVRGYSHRYSGQPRQDDVAVSFDPRSGVLLFAVADGVSSAGHSHIGAAVACNVLVGVQQWMLDGGRYPDLAYAVEEVATKITDRAARILKRDRPDQEAVESLLATTLIGGYIVPGDQGAVVSLVQIGDSGAWVLRGTKYHPLMRQKNDPDAPVISSAVTPLPRLPDKIVPIECPLAPDEVLLLGTDGFGDPLGDGDGHVGNLFAEHLSAPLPARGLAHLLDFSRDTFDDDRTLLAIWPQARQPGGAR
jgi:serine/threonine protein phosphatase PrpC